MGKGSLTQSPYYYAYTDEVGVVGGRRDEKISR